MIHLLLVKYLQHRRYRRLSVPLTSVLNLAILCFGSIGTLPGRYFAARCRFWRQHAIYSLGSISFKAGLIWMEVVLLPTILLIFHWLPLASVYSSLFTAFSSSCSFSTSSTSVSSLFYSFFHHFRHQVQHH